MTIYFDYTAGRGKYEDYDEHENIKEFKGRDEQKKVIQEFNPNFKTNKQENPNIKTAQCQTKTQIKETKPQERNSFYYSYEKESDNKKETYAYSGQQKNQGNVKSFKPTQNYYKKPYNAYKAKKGYGPRRIEIAIGSKYQRNDIED